MTASYLPIAVAFIGLGFAFFLYKRGVMVHDGGEGKIAEIARQIHLGSMVFMRREYTLLLGFVVVLSIACWIGLGWHTAAACIVGALASASAGLMGMWSATKANVRTAVAARDHGQSTALSIAFSGGAIMGLCVAAMGALGLAFLYIWFGPEHVHHIHGFGVGASSVALFSRVGGGIYTKSADVGADLVGKVESGIPEDDPRNPGVIADNVGDNVGDVAGMGSDIFESYCGAMIASMAIASTVAVEAMREGLLVLPLLLAACGLIASVFAIAYVRLRSDSAPATVLRTGMLLGPGIFAVLAWGTIDYLGLSSDLFWAVVCGAVGGVFIGLITEYYTGGKPVRDIAKSGETGPATVMISGLSVGMESVVAPVLALAGIIIGAFTIVGGELGLYGVGIAAVGMLSTVGVTMAVDAYGPVADNAGGIAEMGGMGPETREITDSLDELGNTTAAIGKGFAIGSAALAALAIIAAFSETVSANFPEFALEISNPKVLVGMLIGITVPFLIASITMTSVGDAAFAMINEIRRQFREIDGLLEGREGVQPDTGKCIDIATTAALQKMILPGAIAVITPIAVGFIGGAVMLGGMLGGGLLGCISMALMMANAGGAWDNAKKYVEKGHHGGKGSSVHSATVVGDTVGDPFKDTSGPSMNILINVMAIVSLTIAPLLTL